MIRTRALIPAVAIAVALLASCGVPGRPTVPALVDQAVAGDAAAVVTGPSIAAAGGTLVAIGTVHGEPGVVFGRSTDGGATWSQQPAPEQPGMDHFGRHADAVTHDARHGVWLAITTDSIAAEDGSGMLNQTTVLHRSTDDGRTWSVADWHAGTASIAYAEGALACDDRAASPFYGRCYWADRVAARFGRRGVLWTSDDGGATWQQSEAFLPAHPASVAVAPDGSVTVVHTGDGTITATRSTDGGATVTTTTMATPTVHTGAVVAGDRATVAALADGTLVAAWADCRFQGECTRNDLVLARSTGDGAWSEPVAVPVGEHGEGLDVVVGSVVADAAGLHVAVQAVVDPAACPGGDCRLTTRTASSTDGGTSWNRTVLGDNQPVAALPMTESGQATVGGRLGLTLSAGRPVPAFVVATPAAPGALDVAVHVPRP